MPNLLAVAADALTRSRPGTTAVQAQAPVPVGPRHQLPTTATNLFTATDSMRALNAYRSSSAVYSIVLRRSSDVARIPWALYRNTPSAAATDDLADLRTEIHDHAFLRVWNAPNPLQKTGRQFRQLLLMYLEILGEGTAVVGSWGPGRNAQPAELWVVRPDRLAPIPDPRYGLAGWVHTSEDGEQTPLRTDQVLQIKYPNPMDPLRGMGPVLAAMLEIDAAVLSTEWFRNFYLNSAQPGGIVSTEDHLSKPEMDEWVLRWNEQHGGGPANAHRVALMDKGATWLGAQMSMLDMQFAELVASNREAVRETFGISKVILGQTGDVNRAATLAQQEIYGRYSLQDRVDLLGEMANVELLPRFGSAFVPPGAPAKFVLEPSESVIPDDVELQNAERDSRVGAVTAIVGIGGEPAETLEAFGLPAITITKPEPPPALVPTSDDVEEPEVEQVGEGEQEQPALPPAPDARTVARIVAAVAGEIDPLDGLDDDDDPDAPLDHLQDAWVLALDGLTADYVEIEQAVKGDIVRQLDQLLTAHGLDGLDMLQVNMQLAAERITDAAVVAAADAADAVSRQAEADGFRVAPPVIDRAQLARAATGVAQVLGNRLSSSAKGAVLRAWSGDNEA